MIVASTIEELAAARNRLAAPVAFVPTMGCLHEGHRTLIRRARRLGRSVVVSIYVNPLQFGPGEDFDAYPRTFEADRECCREDGVDLLFHPETLYPEGPPQVRMRVDDRLAGCLCGVERPGHFDGVATVVAILFQLVRPDVAVFGEKDWQQLTIIRRMVRDFHFPVRIEGVPTVREDDGLAMSSRNRYLNEAERTRAGALYSALRAMRSAASSGEKDSARLIELGRLRLEAAGVRPEYLEIRDGDTLAPLERIAPGARAFVAARIGRARLIDNLALEEEPCT